MTTISPDKVTFEDKSLMEQVLLIAELEPEDKNMVLKMIDTFLTKKKTRISFNRTWTLYCAKPEKLPEKVRTEGIGG
ncbi:hypothetical protein [Schleiferia thermophila]|uniref:hypothetical protein n=1 Tax=Schleiferia thermophila TaxID=884107 RepID=UPI002FDB54D4